MKNIQLKPLALSLAVITSAFGMSGCDDKAAEANIEKNIDNNLDQDIDKDIEPKEPSVARRWNEVILAGIRNDFARPTVHARNLFHMSSAMYDSWAAYYPDSPYLLNNTQKDYTCHFEMDNIPEDTLAASEKAISFATYRLIKHRFKLSPDAEDTFALADALMTSLGYDSSNESLDYNSVDIDANAAALGNYIANCYIEYGLEDGSKESFLHRNTVYQPTNLPLEPEMPGNPNIENMDRWQSLDLGTYIDQSGNLVQGSIDFLGAEWGEVDPFALSANDLTIHHRDGYDYHVYHDPGAPPSFNEGSFEEYLWSFSLVAKWSAQLDPADGVMIDISPASQGNIDLASFPTSYKEHASFYQTEGGDIGKGYDINPVTGEAYEKQMVPRGDYTRVLAEFWADGPDSETPPGHWFVIMNEVNDHPEFERKFAGTGEELSPLEWDVKSYFALAGAMHDSAIAAWGIKGWYDYIRPVSAIRALADLGQSSDENLPNYNAKGLALETGLIELVTAEDVLAGENAEHVGKIKLLAWKGPDYIDDPTVDVAGVGWILAENWWPYQRPSFVTPPFAGYVSGHSTYSRAAAELLTLLTGSKYFPGGMSSFEIKADDFLVFEQGPSVDMKLQWATYQDASDQCSLSRIWGGIHPPADDIPGRLIGEKIGKAAFTHASSYFAK
ncbi:vanadium-dependent haloperoxidase [Thalassomonas sp. M1454]|uniref:vanadium-dependent haloperoxidase n=1 Tax=Thalassomonas sp. M1454 TaxID=2594477 RepID=UPI00117BE165|nr:vanadium-dependent haloperoxidase [Thalassomonas sp. M1454]TRX54456.1 vanadium-dependent haloperoxidase [Thalassomonas sp. M1454]